MLHITRKENMVLNQIKYFQNEYKDGVPYRILKLDLDLSEMDLKDILIVLDSKGIVSYKDGTLTLLENRRYKCLGVKRRCEEGRT